MKTFRRGPPLRRGGRHLEAWQSPTVLRRARRHTRCGRRPPWERTLGWKLSPLSPGYARIEGSGYALYLVIIHEVTEAEQDGMLGLFSRKRWTRKQTTWWWKHRMGSLEGVNVQDVDEYDQVIAEALVSMPLEQRLAGLAPEQRVAGLAPEQRVAGLTLEQQLLALPDEVLRGMSKGYLRSLPAEVASAIRARIGRPRNH